MRLILYFSAPCERIPSSVEACECLLTVNGGHESFVRAAVDKDVSSFADWANTYRHNNGIMSSLDVSSIFTNVRLDETIQICLDKLYSLPDPPILLRSVLPKLLEFATEKSHFIFDGQYYDQTESVAMGLPLGPVLANIFMCHFEEKWVMNGRVRPILWYRYVDDTFTIFDSKDTAIEFFYGI